MDIVERLRAHALPDPHDEREVMHAPLLREAAVTIQQQADRIRELEQECEALRIKRNDEMRTADEFRTAYATQTEQLAEVVEYAGKLRDAMGKLDMWIERLPVPTIGATTNLGIADAALAIPLPKAMQK